jgi:hypothetical protein
MEDEDAKEIQTLKEIITALIESMEMDEDAIKYDDIYLNRVKKKLRNVVRILIQELGIEEIDDLEEIRPHLTREGYELLLKLLLDE